MKTFFKIILSLAIICSLSLTYVEAKDYIDDLSGKVTDLDVSVKQEGGDKGDVNEHLAGFKDGRHVDASNSGEKGISIFLVKIARDLKNLFFAIAIIYFLVITIKLLFSENSEEEFGKFKKGILWITVGIIIMQLAYTFVTLSFDKGADGEVAYNLIQGIIDPLIRLLETAASFFFIAIAIFAFYRMVSANGDEEKAKSGKMTIMYAIIGFLVIKVARLIVRATYDKTYCEVEGVSCSDGVKTLEDGSSIIFDIINWLNGFVGIVVVIMIVYVGAQLIFSSGEEEKVKKAKTAMIYIFVGIFILIVNYLILTFFLTDNIATAIN